jgi:hypothetical protein
MLELAHHYQTEPRYLMLEWMKHNSISDSDLIPTLEKHYQKHFPPKAPLLSISQDVSSSTTVPSTTSSEMEYF